jgi:hypothetical protein
MSPPATGYERIIGRKIYGYLEKGIQTPMTEGRSTKIISFIKWIRTRRLPTNNPLPPSTSDVGRQPLSNEYGTYEKSNTGFGP